MEDEKQTSLDTEVGNTETITLPAKPVRVVGVRIDKVKGKGGKENEKLVLISKHPDKVENIEISQMKYEIKGILKFSGLWINKDKEGKLIKNSALAILMNTIGIKTMRDFEAKDIPTILDDRGYLAFKCY